MWVVPFARALPDAPNSWVILADLPVRAARNLLARALPAHRNSGNPLRITRRGCPHPLPVRALSRGGSVERVRQVFVDGGQVLIIHIAHRRQGMMAMTVAVGSVPMRKVA